MGLLILKRLAHMQTYPTSRKVREKWGTRHPACPASGLWFPPFENRKGWGSQSKRQVEGWASLPNIDVFDVDFTPRMA
jgi:hypothetical protein